MEEPAPEMSAYTRPPLSPIQLAVSTWAIAYGVWIHFLETSMEPGASLFSPLALILIGVPVACIVIGVAYFRGGEALATVLLTLATISAAGSASGDMRGMPEGFSWALVLFGGPCVLVRGHYVNFVRRARFEKSR